jgi:hypothetical protein
MFQDRLDIPDDRFEKSLTISIDESAVFRLQGYLRPEDHPDDKVRNLYQSCLEIAHPMLRPLGFLRFHRLISIEGDRLEVAGGVILRGINLVRTFHGSEVLCTGLVTIGSALEENVRKLFADNELAMGLMLDSVGSEAAEGAAIALDEIVTRISRDHHWERTPRMSPGYGSFEIHQQASLFKLLESHGTGVTLTPSFIMLPQKSISFVVGLGPHVRHFKHLSPCRVCDLADCQVRDPRSNRCLH